MPCSSSYSTHPACRRPASGPQLHAWAALPAPVFFRKSRKGGPARSGGPPFLESPGIERTLGRRRGGGMVLSKHHQKRPPRETTTMSPRTRSAGVGRRYTPTSFYPAVVEDAAKCAQRGG